MKKQPCPVCCKKKFVIPDGNSSAYGSSGGSGPWYCGVERLYYCTKCFVEFKIRVDYIIHQKDKRIGQSGPTGFTR